MTTDDILAFLRAPAIQCILYCHVAIGLAVLSMYLPIWAHLYVITYSMMWIIGGVLALSFVARPRWWLVALVTTLLFESGMLVLCLWQVTAIAGL